MRVARSLAPCNSRCGLCLNGASPKFDRRPRASCGRWLHDSMIAARPCRRATTSRVSHLPTTRTRPPPMPCTPVSTSQPRRQPQMHPLHFIKPLPKSAIKPLVLAMYAGSRGPGMPFSWTNWPHLDEPLSSDSFLDTMITHV